MPNCCMSLKIIQGAGRPAGTSSAQVLASSSKPSIAARRATASAAARKYPVVPPNFKPRKRSCDTTSSRFGTSPACSSIAFNCNGTNCSYIRSTSCSVHATFQADFQRAAMPGSPSMAKVMRSVMPLLMKEMTKSSNLENSAKIAETMEKALAQVAVEEQQAQAMAQKKTNSKN